MNIITIDTGTTNTRMTLWRYSPDVSNGDQFIALNNLSSQVGVRDTASSGNHSVLKNAIKELLHELLNNSGIAKQDIDHIIATGMISSNLGLTEVPHIIAPASINDLANAILQKRIEDVIDIPVWFVPGVKNFTDAIDLENFEQMDMMRGEEVEAFALINRLNLTDPCVLVLPGSHSKFVCIDHQQNIVGCATSISGELLQVISKQTIVADAVESDYVTTLDESLLLKGAELANKVGLSRACFSLRVLNQFSDYSRNERANILMGAILSTDIVALKHSRSMTIRHDMSFIIAGKKILRQAFSVLLKHDAYFSGKIIETNEEQQSNLSGFGALLIAQEKGLLST